MDDLIDREALIKAYLAAHKGPPGRAFKLIQYAPAVDAEPVKKGKWLYHRVSRIGNTCIEHVQTEKCSACKRYITTPFVYGRTVNNYCPHCGAKMEVGE
jgi:hypothetical protein